MHDGRPRFLYEGKAKILFEADHPNYVIQYFKDDATAFNAAKRGVIESKGIINLRIAETIFRYLGQQGIPTHFVGMISDREMLVERCEIVPLEFIVRNRVAGSMSKRLGLPEGEPLPAPFVELSYKNDALGDPLVTDDHVAALKLISGPELTRLKQRALEINDRLLKFFRVRGILLVDFKIEFGRNFQGRWVLADEISPDTCRLWDERTLEKLDKDRFRRDLGRVKEAYEEVLRRVTLP